MNAHAESTPQGWVLVLVRDLRHPPAAVWAALTEPAQLAAAGRRTRPAGTWARPATWR